MKQLLLLATFGFMIYNPAMAYKELTNKNSNSDEEKSVTAGCVPATASTFLELNNVRALIHTGGDMWWDLRGNASYEVPKGSGKHALFAGAIWIGGTDVNGQLRLCAQKYRSSGNENWPGPLQNTGSAQGSVTSDMCSRYDRHFVVLRDDVAEFRSWYQAKQENNTVLLESQFLGYTVPKSIQEWPAINNEPNYDYFLAPFWDENGDSYYDPNDGDYPFFDLDKILPCGTSQEYRVPRLFGDETMWWVYNDRGNVHTEMDGASIGMEIRAQSFAFSTNDELNNMTFGNYALINRSTYVLENTYFGVWTDADLGDAYDDYVGCDVKRGLGYLYNGDEDDGDGNGQTYGSQPPAIGVDFFEGPYQDIDGSDFGFTGVPGGCDESINGLNFNDGQIDNERWGMRRFLYFNNSGGVNGDPTTAVETYNYLRGYWRDGTRMTFGANGYQSSTTPADFMFPGNPNTDTCGWGTGGIPQGPWSEKTVNNTAADRRFVQSAGPFTLEPGATNDITVGMVWARATQGSAWASVQEVRRADDKAQRLFDVCFKIIDGPNAPELDIIELDRELIFHIYNLRGSNNYMVTPEDYTEKDPFIICPDSGITCDVNYRFEGYQVFQLKDESSSVTDITNPDKARLVFQCDIKNGVGRLINYEYDQDLGVSIPTLKVEGADQGVLHTFRITDDQFASGDKRLVNHKTYYFIAIAYGYNNYKTYDPTDGNALDGQKFPYLASRKGGSGSIRSRSAIPHVTNPANAGTILNATYGDGPKIIKLEGYGNGDNNVEITKKTEDKIMSGAPWRADSVEFENGYGPIQVKVIDPLNVPDYDFALKFDSVTSDINTGYITKSKWYVYAIGVDTIWADRWIDFQNEQLIPEWGISISITQTQWPGENKNPNQNGYITSSTTWVDPYKRWLDFEFTSDGENCDVMNWIRAGTAYESQDPGCKDEVGYDDDEDYEKVMNGTWAPYKLTAVDYKGGDAYPSYTHGIAYDYGQDIIKWFNFYLQSVDVVITTDKSRWSRCPVIEMCEYDNNGGTMFTVGLSEGGAMKFSMRKHASIDKAGSTTNILSGDSSNSNYSNFVAGNGMGWFPGYCIDIESGERLNIIYGEDSKYPGQNGRDMLWNPTNEYASDLYYYTGGTAGDLYLGGKHYIYVFGHNKKVTDPDYMPAYDNGEYLYSKFNALNASATSLPKRRLWVNAMWVTLPMLSPEVVMEENPVDPYYFIKTDVRFKIRIANPYRKGINDYAVASPENDNNPYYLFNLRDMKPVTNDNATAVDALDLIRVVPNPYYGYSAYEQSQLENLVKITNLPQKCTISIFSVNGTLIRRFSKDNALSYQDWDLKNAFGITVASGLYIVHVDAPGIGEKVIKWFGALRPIDLNNF